MENWAYNKNNKNNKNNTKESQPKKRRKKIKNPTNKQTKKPTGKQNRSNLLVSSRRTAVYQSSVFLSDHNQINKTAKRLQGRGSEEQRNVFKSGAEKLAFC